MPVLVQSELEVDYPSHQTVVYEYCSLILKLEAHGDVVLLSDLSNSLVVQFLDHCPRLRALRNWGWVRRKLVELRHVQLELRQKRLQLCLDARHVVYLKAF